MTFAMSRRARTYWTLALLIPALVVYLGTAVQTQEPEGGLTLDEVTTLLTLGTPMTTIEDAIRELGVDFRLTAAIEANLRTAGATDSFLQVLRTLRAPPALEVFSDPPGATVSLDGEVRGQTPLLTTTTPGPHDIVLSLAGYLDNLRSVTARPGETEIIDVTLTATGLEAEPSAGGGSRRTLLLLGLAGGGGAAIATLVGGSGDAANLPPPTVTNTPPQGGTFTTSPTGVGLLFATDFQFTATGVTDPDGDPITYLWEFGDGSGNPPSATTVFKTYTEARDYSVGLAVTDSKSPPRLVERQTVTVASLEGRWSGHIGGGGCSASSDFITLDIIQIGTGLSGSYSDDTNGAGSLSGSVSTPRKVNLTHMIPGFSTGTWTGSADAAINTISGSVDWFDCGTTDFEFRRQ